MYIYIFLKACRKERTGQVSQVSFQNTEQQPDRHMEGVT